LTGQWVFSVQIGAAAGAAKFLPKPRLVSVATDRSDEPGNDIANSLTVAVKLKLPNLQNFCSLVAFNLGFIFT
jgi:hypothetical protein